LPDHIWRPADARGPNGPLGRVLDRKKIGSFVFVSHHYPKLEERASHSHPWLHLTLVGRGHYSRKLGRRTAHYQAGSLSFLQTNESHTDSYAPGSKCLHVVIPAEVEQRLTRDFGVQGTTGEVPPNLSARFSIALQSEFRRADRESPLIVEALLCDLVSRHLNFADQSHFTRAFKNHFGITPGEWRRQGCPTWRSRGRSCPSKSS
jgi:hypothetical protein